MLASIALVIALFATPLRALAQPHPAIAPTDTISTASNSDTATFLDIPWYSSLATTRHTLAQHGYAFRYIDRDGDAWFKGTLYDEPTLVVAFFDEHRQLVKIQAHILTPNDDCESTYDSVVHLLSVVYGPPDHTVIDYTKPFSPDDGDFETATLTGNANVGAYWIAPDRPSSDLAVHVARNLTIDVQYQSARWETVSLSRARHVSRR